MRCFYTGNFPHYLQLSAHVAVLARVNRNRALGAVCALILGAVVGCLGDPYYIDNAFGPAQSSPNSQVNVHTSTAASSTLPPSSEPSESATAPSGGDAAPSSSSDVIASSTADATVSTLEAEAGADTPTPDTSASDSSTSDPSGGAPDAGLASGSTNGNDTWDLDAGTNGESGDANSPRQGAFVQGACWPMCNMADVDDVIDGWGAQYDRSCVRQNTEAPACAYEDESAGLRIDGECYAPCPGPTLDADEDGWEEVDSEVCVVTGTSLAMSAQACPYP